MAIVRKEEWVMNTAVEMVSISYHVRRIATNVYSFTVTAMERHVMIVNKVRL